jgi:hypothetical protein
MLRAMKTLHPVPFTCLVMWLGALLLATACGKSAEPASGTPAAPSAAEPAPVAAPPAPAPTEPTAAGPAAQLDTAIWSDLEGEIGLQWGSITPPKPAQSIVAQVKAGKIRFGVPEGVESARAFGDKAYVVVDTSQKKLFAVSEQKREVVTLDLDQIEKQMAQFKAGMPNNKQESKAPPKVEKTGREAAVAGYRCDEWDVTAADGDKSRVCVATIRTSFFSLPTMNLPAEHAWAKELFDGNHLPLRVITLEPNGTERSKLEVTKVEKKALDDALFAMPPGYKVVDLGEMMRGMAKMMAAMQGMPGMPGATGPSGPPGAAPGPGMPPNMEAVMRQMAAHAKAGAKGGQPPPDMKAMIERMKAQAAEAKKNAKASPDTKATTPSAQ